MKGSLNLRLNLHTLEEIEKQRSPEESPHAHTQFTLIWVRYAKGGWHEIDFIKYPLEPPVIYFLRPSHCHFFKGESPQGYALQFSQDELCSLGISDLELESFGLFAEQTDSPFLNLSQAQDHRLLALISKLEQELKNPESPFHKEMCATWLKLFLLTCARFKAQNRPHLETQDIPDTEHKLILAFKELVRQHHNKEHKVGFYAEQIGVTPDTLNQKLKQFTPHTAKEHIQNHIMLSAKRAAYFSTQSAKQIAYTLGFDDPAHFSKFFKNCEGQSFQAFRESLTQKYKP